ncbi:hypothetical protein HYT26_00480, partial [Candidatus Pacearchaeota archaeon]|nr:hypothetical protein [Candidatus Pacearchaeota archaeon]
LPMLLTGFTALLSPVGLYIVALGALAAAIIYVNAQHEKFVDNVVALEMATGESTSALDRFIIKNFGLSDSQEAAIEQHKRAVVQISFLEEEL